MPNENQRLLVAVRSRKSRGDLGYGIVTADRYIRNLQDCAGHEACNRFCTTRSRSYDDLIKQGQSVLTYANDEMVVQDLYNSWKKEFPTTKDVFGNSIELPNNTLMVFKHCLTTPKKDRDGDILRTQGAVPDPKMLLLYQHNHSLPVGKMLGIAEHTSQKLSPISAIIDVNPLCHDVAVMTDAKMGRFSHGFDPWEFSEEKSADGWPWFDIKRYGIMEESWVSVPSNTDAETEEILYSLYSGGKLTSPIMKEHGLLIQKRRNLTLNVPGSFEESHDESTDTATKTESGTDTKHTCTCGTKHHTDTTGTSEETGTNTGAKSDATHKEVNCSKCGSKMVDGKCSKCGYADKSTDTPETPELVPVEQTAKQAMGFFLAHSTPAERQQMKQFLKTLEETEQANALDTELAALFAE